MNECNHAYDHLLFHSCPVCGELDSKGKTIHRIATMSDTELVCQLKYVQQLWDRVKDKQFTDDISWFDYAEMLHIEISDRIQRKGEI